MKRHWLVPVMLLACAGFVVAQDQGASTTTTTTTTTQQSAPAQQSTPATTQAPINPHPQGTHVKSTERDTIVEPTAKQVQVTPSLIQAAQQKLASAGYHPGPADGIMGARTRAAIAKFQTDNSLQQTGRLDSATMAKLGIGAGQSFAAAPADLGRGGKALGHDVAEGHPVAGAKAGAKGAEDFGSKVAHGTESGASKVEHTVGKGLSSIGSKISGTGKKVEQKGQPPQNPDQTNTNPPPQQ